MKRLFVAVALIILAVASFAQSAVKEKLASNTPKVKIIFMNPANVDPSDLPLDRVDQIHSTGTPQKIGDISTWRLVVAGKALERPLSLSYAELSALPSVSKRVLLICPAFFADYVEWEGVPLSTLLEKAGARPDFRTVSFKSYDGYEEKFGREETTKHLLFLALRVNGQILTPIAGYPVRLVAEDIFGGHWVKWITEIHVD
jgi:DMSO/TMAO reductase YedYZ molybdopterin-dependent catalytic subunit